MKWTVIGLVACGAAACGGSAEHEFLEGIPNEEMIKVSVPDQESSSRLAPGQYGLKAEAGARANTYILTRVATDTVNGAAAFVLHLLEEITERAPTSVNGDIAVWGPHTKPLSLLTWRLTVTRTAEKQYTYALEAKHKSEPDTTYQTIVSGSHHAVLKNYGSGSFIVDWDRAARLPEHGNDVGSAEFTYARPSAQSDATLAVHFQNVRDGEQQVNAEYRYKKTPAMGGEFEFAVKKDLGASFVESALEKWTIKSRWEQSGVGRADAKLSGGDLGSAEATLSECWDTQFASVYLEMSYAPDQGYGDEPVDCAAFPTESYSSL